jgi:small neutral amino acid transporter SnatA (MarC family)
VTEGSPKDDRLDDPCELKGRFLHNWWMDHTSITAAGVIDTFLVLLIGVGPKLALVPFVEITSSLDAATKRRVLRQMMVTAATVALILMVLGELLRALLHFTVDPCRSRVA